MNFETLRRIGELEKKVEKLTEDLGNLAAQIAKSEAQQQERRTLTLPKKDAGYRQASSGD